MNDTLNFADLFKQSFLDGAMQDLNLARMLLTLGLALLLGIFLHFVYKRTFRGVLYSQSFHGSLIAITMITSLVIMAVTSNIVLSLGMVGALSIVRFRTAVKDPMDMVYMFWAIGIGIVTGAGLYLLALLGSVIIGLILYMMSRSKSTDTPYLLIVQSLDDTTDTTVLSALTGSGPRFSLKSKTIAPTGIEATYEVRVKDGASRLINEIAGIKGVQNAVLIAYNGDYVA
jgi:uncharacterized membrane protein YhiD involved in acid resistance